MCLYCWFFLYAAYIYSTILLINKDSLTCKALLCTFKGSKEYSLKLSIKLFVCRYFYFIFYTTKLQIIC